MTNHRSTVRRRAARGLLALAAVATIGMAPACQKTTDITPPAGRVDGGISPSGYPRIVVQDGLDAFIGFSATIEKPGTGSTPMEIVQPLRMLGEDDVNVQYRFEFLDGRGVAVGPQPDWRFLHLDSRVQEQVRGIALDVRAVDWRLRVRSAR